MTRQGDVPRWLTAVLSIAAMLVGIIGDRVALASTIATIDARVTSVEKRLDRGEAADAQILKKLEEIQMTVIANGLQLQELSDKQKVVLSRLGLKDLISGR